MKARSPYTGEIVRLCSRKELSEAVSRCKYYKRGYGYSDFTIQRPDGTMVDVDAA